MQMSFLDSPFFPFRRKKVIVPTESQRESLPVMVVRTIVIVYEPAMDRRTGVKLSQYMRWNNVEDLAKGYMSDVLEVSGGLVRYQIVQRIDVDEFPAKVDGYRYDPITYYNVVQGMMRPYMPQEADYYQIIERFNILNLVASDQIDEVWIFNFPHAGFYERGVGEMLENLGHRVESIMQKTFEGLNGEANLWERFCRYDKVSPGRAALGNVHFAPNSVRDYDWGNSSKVVSECDDWLYNFPNFKGGRRTVT